MIAIAVAATTSVPPVLRTTQISTLTQSGRALRAAAARPSGALATAPATAAATSPIRSRVVAIRRSRLPRTGCRSKWATRTRTVSACARAAEVNSSAATHE